MIRIFINLIIRVLNIMFQGRGNKAPKFRPIAKKKQSYPKPKGWVPSAQAVGDLLKQNPARINRSIIPLAVMSHHMPSGFYWTIGLYVFFYLLTTDKYRQKTFIVLSFILRTDRHKTYSIQTSDSTTDVQELGQRTDSVKDNSPYMVSETVQDKVVQTWRNPTDPIPIDELWENQNYKKFSYGFLIDQQNKWRERNTISMVNQINNFLKPWRRLKGYQEAVNSMDSEQLKSFMVFFSKLTYQQAKEQYSNGLPSQD